MIFSRLCVPGLFLRQRVSLRAFLPFSFLSALGSPPRRTSPASHAAANIQYIGILARVSDCVRLLPTLRADAIGKKNHKSDGGAGSGSYISAGERNAKACVSHASRRGRGCDRGCAAGDRSDRRPGALAAGNELAEESRYALRQCRSYVSTRGATDRQEIPDPELRWRG